MTTSTVRLHRVLRCPPERLFKAFTDRLAYQRWLPPFGFTGEVLAMDTVVGGQYRMAFTNFSTGHSHSFGGTYLELEPGRRVVYDAAFDDPNLPGRMVTQVTFTQVSCGTELHIEQSGIPSVIPVEMCYLGWQESLVNLAHLVEPEIPG